MTIHSVARAIFDEIALPPPSERWARIEKFVSDQEDESLHLDFKEVRPTTSPKTDQYVREKLARALSAFANTEGGVLVYGVGTNDAQKKGTPDRAQRISKIQGLGRFQLELENLCSTCVDPPVAAVEVRAVEDPSAQDEGVIVVYVPPSDGGPHRVIGTKVDVDEKYFMRTTTETVVMPHSLLADRFGRTAPPKLQLLARFSNSAPLTLELRIRNVGRGAAIRPALLLFEPSVEFDWKLNSKLTTGFVGTANHTQEGKARILFEPHEDGKAPVVIYPEMDRVVLFTCNQGSKPASSHHWIVSLRGQLHALSMRPVAFSGKLEIPIGRHDPLLVDALRLVLPEGA